MSLIQWIIVIIATGLPVAGWIYLFFSQRKNDTKIITLIFFLGCITAPLFLGFQYLWLDIKGVTLDQSLRALIPSTALFTIISIALFAIIEEFIKFIVVHLVDKKTLLINKINDAIRYSIVAALGFAFIENIYYIQNLWGAIPTNQIIATYIFRSLFTMCGHLIYSGIFGYHYAIGKFSIVVKKQQNLSGKTSITEKILSNIFKIPPSESYRQKMIIKGLIIATTMHVIQNYLLEYGHQLLTIAFITLNYFYLNFLLNRKAGHLILTEDISTKSKSTLAQKDEDVVVELLGMWFSDKRFVDVIHVCERLLERDPDNNVVKLFKARATDRMNEKDTYHKILSNVLKTKEQRSTDDNNKLTKYIKEKAALKKVKAKIKKIVESQGKKFIDPAKLSSQKDKSNTPSTENKTYKL